MENVWAIYRILSKNGKQIRIDIKEYCDSEEDAVRFSKLYNNQVPHDLRDRINFRHVIAAVQ